MLLIPILVDEEQGFCLTASKSAARWCSNGENGNFHAIKAYIFVIISPITLFSVKFHIKTWASKSASLISILTATYDDGRHAASANVKKNIFRIE